ncbi:MAG: flavodoxin family protein [Rhodocyclaceae bacterium]
MTAAPPHSTAGAAHPGDARKRLLIVYHTQSGNTGRLADAVLRGARRVDEIDTRLLRAFDAGVDDLLTCHGLLLGTPENFGTMSGALKDFFDRTYYPCEGRLTGLPYAVFISAGNDGSGAVREIGRIANGYGWKTVAEPVICRGSITPDALSACEDLGEAMAAGLALGIL